MQTFNRAVFLPGPGLPPQINWQKAVTFITEHDQSFPAQANDHKSELPPDAGISPRRLSRHSSRQPVQHVQSERISQAVMPFAATQTLPNGSLSVKSARPQHLAASESGARTTSSDVSKATLEGDSAVPPAPIQASALDPVSSTSRGGVQDQSPVGGTTVVTSSTEESLSKTSSHEPSRDDPSADGEQNTPSDQVAAGSNDMDVTEDGFREVSVGMEGSDMGPEDGQGIREKRKAAGDPDQDPPQDSPPEETGAAVAKKTKRRRKNPPKSAATIPDDTEDVARGIEEPPTDLTQPWLVYHSNAPGASTLKAWGTDGPNRCKKCQGRHIDVCWTVPGRACEACRMSKIRCDHTVTKTTGTAVPKAPGSSTRQSRTVSAPPDVPPSDQIITEAPGVSGPSMPQSRTGGAAAPNLASTSTRTLDVVSPGHPTELVPRIGSTIFSAPQSSILDETIENRVWRAEGHIFQLAGMLRERNEQLKAVQEQLDSLKTFVAQKFSTDNVL